jgi:NAD(P)H-hydrate epimerase
LLKKRTVIILLCFPLAECRPLCCELLHLLKNKGIELAVFHSSYSFPEKGVLLDGILGSGFQGKLEGSVAICVEKANCSGLPLYAIDIPSGLNGNTGEPGGIAIRASHTFWISFPKRGFFLGEGWNHVGSLSGIDCGLPLSVKEKVQPSALLIDKSSVSSFFPPLVRNRHKYEAGYLLNLSGSKGMAGAAFLSSLAAMRAGCGIVRLFYGKGMEEELGGAPWEVIKESISLSQVLAELSRASALLIGPGMGRSLEAQNLFEDLLPQLIVPTVLDGDALYFLSLTSPSEWKLSPLSLLTPHRGEMGNLLKETPTVEKCQKLCDQIGALIILKGGPTWIFSPTDLPLVSPLGNPGMATAGSGDVFSGILASFLSQGMKPHQAALLACIFHGMCGEVAAEIQTPRALIASDLLKVFPQVFRFLIGTA